MVAPSTFDAVYREYAPFVWRHARRLGVAPNAVDDVMQEVFVVVLRRLGDFEPRASIRAWLSAILVRVVRTHRRGQARQRLEDVDTDTFADVRSAGPHEEAERAEAAREVRAILATMNAERRRALHLAALEERTAPEIAQALEVNLNTVYSRLRIGRREFRDIALRKRTSARQAAIV